MTNDLMTTMGRTQVIGNLGERIAKEYLEKIGFKFLEANWRCKAGEIDLIMQDGETRVFVEVRSRAATQYGMSSDTVAWQKQRKLLKTAQWYMQVHDYWDDVRFDVVAIDGAGKVEHIEGAFEAL